MMDLQKLEDRFDQLAAETEGVDRCCTYAPWLFSAWEAFSPEAPPFIYEGEEGVAALMRVQIDEQRWLLVPLEYAWRLGAPLVGPAPQALLEAVYRALESYRADGFLGCLVSGYAEQSPWANALASYAPSGLQSAGFLEPRGRHIASLSGGFEGFMSRRSAKFRSELRRGDRRMRTQGIEAELHQRPLSEEQLSDLFARFIQVEKQSWK
ncbi:MAG: hypothetical protein VYD19_08475, partial [Myxococcota bacterium]|nr:hypothetical protein [Myxococcota bacterium]